MKNNSLILESLVVAREGAALSAPVSLTLAGGEVLLVQGSNGSGKSTLLKTLAGLLPVHRGRIRMNGVWPCEPHPLYLGHKRGLIPGMSVHDNVAFWAHMAGVRELTAAALHYFDLTDIAGVAVAELSAGWQQRVALTRLITMPATLWLLDEPTANLDAEGIALLQSLLQTRAEQGGIVIIASHLSMQGNHIKTINLNKLNADIRVAS